MKSLIARIALILVIVVMAQGCLAAIGLGAAGGAAGTIYVKGSLKEYLSYPMPTVYAAARLSLQNQGLELYVDEMGDKKAKLRSEYANGDKIRIDIERVTTEHSYIRIRFGATGDQGRSLRLLEKVKAGLF